MATDYEEKELLERLRKGDQTAFIKIYDHYKQPLYIFISRFVKVPAYADDLLQDIFLKLWEIRARINPDFSFKAYLYRISRNMVYKFLKKIAVDEKLLSDTLYYFRNESPDAELSLQWKQYEEQINEAILQLPPKRQMVFRLCREQHKSYDEVSAVLGISRNTVKEHMVLSMKSISNYLKIHSDISLPFLVLFFLGK